MNADGSNPTQITSTSRDDGDPAWSPDGRQIVFQRDFDPVRGQDDNDMLTMRADGTRERNLTNSPGVQEIDRLVARRPTDRVRERRDGDGEIYTMKPDGSRVRQLTANDGPSDSGPDWSPDGRKIAFDSDRDAVEETPFQVEIYTMRADGGDQTRLTFDDLSDFVPSWSPDGRKIAFSSFRDATEEDGSTRRSTRCARTAATSPTSRRTWRSTPAPTGSRSATVTATRHSRSERFKYPDGPEIFGAVRRSGVIRTSACADDPYPR